jgi:hypothetical protein
MNGIGVCRLEIGSRSRQQVSVGQAAAVRIRQQNRFEVKHEVPHQIEIALEKFWPRVVVSACIL